MECRYSAYLPVTDYMYSTNCDMMYFSYCRLCVL